MRKMPGAPGPHVDLRGYGRAGAAGPSLRTIKALADEALRELSSEFVSANVKMSEIARMELTHLRERASSTETPWRWCKEIVKGWE